MKKIIRRGLLMFMSLSAIASFGIATVTAQSNGQVGGNGFRISPVRAEYTIDKGKSEVMTVTVENPTDFAITAKPRVTDFLASDNETGETRPILDESAPRPKNSIKDLIETPAPLDLNPKEKKDIPVTIRVPENANSGGYYGVILFEPAIINKEGNVGLSASTGPIVLVRVPGDLTERLELLEISAAQNDKSKSFFTSGDVSAIVRLKNSGDIHVKPFGKVQVKNMFGHVVKEYELNSVEPRANILPDSTRKFTDAIPKPKIGWLGRYTIEANLGYNQGGGQLIHAQTTFWYLPSWAILVLLVLIAAIGGAIFWLLKGRDMKRLHRPAKRGKS